MAEKVVFHRREFTEDIQKLIKVDLTKEDDLKKVCHYSNLRPLWWDKNLGRRYGKES